MTKDNYQDAPDIPLGQNKPPACFESLNESIPISGVDVQGFEDPVLGDLPIPHAQALTLFVEHRILPGNFLAAMLAGDLELASKYETNSTGIGEANPSTMPLVAYWIWRYAPRESFGSLNAVTTWIGGAV